MTDDTITKLPAPSGISPDLLTDVIRDGARKLIEQAIEVELAALEQMIRDEEERDIALGALADKIRARLATPRSEFVDHEDAFAAARATLTAARRP